MPIASSGCYLYFWPTRYNSECPTNISLGLINLLEWLTEVRETYYLLDYWFITKDIKQPNEEIYRMRSWTKELCPHGAWGPAWWHVEVFLFPHMDVHQKKGPMSCPPWFLWRLYYSRYSIKHNDYVISGHWQWNSIFSEGVRWAWKCQTFHHMVGSLDKPWVRSKIIISLTKQKTPLALSTLRKFQRLWEL